MPVSVFLRIDTGVIWIGDVNMTDHCLIIAKKTVVRFQSGLWETEALEFHKFYGTCLSVEVKYAVKFSLTGLLKCYRK